MFNKVFPDTLVLSCLQCEWNLGQKGIGRAEGLSSPRGKREISPTHMSFASRLIFLLLNNNVSRIVQFVSLCTCVDHFPPSCVEVYQKLHTRALQIYVGVSSRHAASQVLTSSQREERSQKSAFPHENLHASGSQKYMGVGRRHASSLVVRL